MDVQDIKKLSRERSANRVDTTVVRLKCGMRPNVRENSSKGSLPVLDEAGSGFRLWGDVALLIEEFLYEK